MRLSGVPIHWRNRITHEWRDLRALHQIDARRTANLCLLNITERLNALRLPLNADDNLIRDTAKKKALECLGAASVFVDVKERRRLLERMVRRFNCEPPKPMRVTRNGTIVD